MLTLIDLFKRQFNDDPEVVKAIKIASNCFWGHHRCACEAVLEGRLTPSNQYWPASLDDYDLAVEWMDAFGVRYGRFAPEAKKGRMDWIAGESEEDRLAFAKVRAAEAIVRKRFGDLMASLRDGTQEARGHLASGAGAGAEILISKAIWNRPSTRIDFINGEVLRITEAPITRPEGWAEGTERRTEKLDREWTGLMVIPVAAAPAAPSPTPTERNKGGAVEKYPWGSALDRVTVRVGRKGLPETGAELARWVAEALEQEGADGIDIVYVKQHLRTKHRILWDACVQKGNHDGG